MLNYVKGMQENFAFSFAPEIYLAAGLSALPVVLPTKHLLNDGTRYSKFQPVLYGGMLLAGVRSRPRNDLYLFQVLIVQSERDTTLLNVELEAAPIRFLAILSMTFLALAVAWGMSARSLAAVHYSPTRLTASDANLGALAKYAAANDKNVAWVGSSLTAALSERYFTIPGSYNLGLSGGNPLTALEVLQRLPSLPKVVIIETNILDRPVDHTLVDRPWDTLRNP